MIYTFHVVGPRGDDCGFDIEATSPLEAYTRVFFHAETHFDDEDIKSIELLRIRPGTLAEEAAREAAEDAAAGAA